MKAGQSQKIHTIGKESKKSTPMELQKSTPLEEGKTTSYYLPVEVWGVVNEGELEGILREKNQNEWASRKRIAGLLLLLAYFAKKNKPAKMAAKTAHQYVSYFRKAKNPKTIREPLALLVKVGLLRQTQQAVNFHRKSSAAYRISPFHGKPRKITIEVTEKQRENRRNAPKRLKAGLYKKYPILERLERDLECIGVSSGWHEKASEMLLADKGSQSIKTFKKALDEGPPYTAKPDRQGTWQHYARCLPSELKPFLTLGGEPVAICDISSAHIHCLLRVIKNRLDHTQGKSRKSQQLKAETETIARILQSSDFYSELGRSENREAFKKSLLACLNMQTAKAIHIEAYKQMKAAFPAVVGVIEDIKKDEHRALSWQLQRFTSEVIDRAILNAQRKGIACIPDTDALLVPESSEAKTEQILAQVLSELIY